VDKGDETKRLAGLDKISCRKKLATPITDVTARKLHGKLVELNENMVPNMVIRELGESRLLLHDEDRSRFFAWYSRQDAFRQFVQLVFSLFLSWWESSRLMSRNTSLPNFRRQWRDYALGMGYASACTRVRSGYTGQMSPGNWHLVWQYVLGAIRRVFLTHAMVKKPTSLRELEAAPEVHNVAEITTASRFALWAVLKLTSQDAKHPSR